MKPYLKISFHVEFKKNTEIVEKIAVEVDVKIRYLVLQNGKNYIFKLDFYTLFETQKKFETIFRKLFSRRF